MLKSAAIWILQSKSRPPVHFSNTAYSIHTKRRRWFSCWGVRVWKLSRDKSLDPGSDILGPELSDGGCLQSSGGIYWNTCWKCWKCPNTPFLSWALKWLGFFQGSRTTTPSCAASWPTGHTALLRGRYNIYYIYSIYSIYGKVGVPVLICATMPLLI